MRTVAYISVRDRAEPSWVPPSGRDTAGRGTTRPGLEKGRDAHLLLHRALEAAVNTETIERIFVRWSARSIGNALAGFAHRKVVPLPPASAEARDADPAEPCPPRDCPPRDWLDPGLLAWAREESFERVVLVRPDAFAGTFLDLEGALREMDRTGVDSLLSVTEDSRRSWKRVPGQRIVPCDGFEHPQAQDAAYAGDDYPSGSTGEVREDGAFCITSRQNLLDFGSAHAGDVGYWIIGQFRTPSEAVPDVRLLVSDVDGVLTDAGMYYGPSGDSLKKFNSRDGMGIVSWLSAGRPLAIVTGEDSPAVAHRARKLKIPEVHLGIQDKLPVVQRIAQKYGVSLSQTAYMGDDLNDLRALRYVGFPACPFDAVPEVLAVSRFRSQKCGGQGCLRDLIDYLLV